jgi:HD-GYP domain-containing protein (c-di-GMP phosphodiesterase class II)
MAPRPRTPRATVAAALLRMAEWSGACMPGRGQGVSATAVLLGRGVGMRSGRVAELAESAQLLDIGLTGLPLHVAQRSRPLTEEEEAEYQLHPLRSLELARNFGLMFEHLNGILHHHERHDGLGYPMGLAGQEIPEFARILAIADAYDRMTRGRPGEVKLPAGDAVIEISALAGTHFDPELVKVFSRVIAERQPIAPDSA